MAAEGSFEKISEILDEVDDIENVDKMVRECCVEYGFPIIMSSIPLKIISMLSTIISGYLDMEQMINSIKFDDNDIQNEIKKKILIINSIFKSGNIGSGKFDKHILTQYYLMLCMTIILSRDKFNNSLLEFMENIEKIVPEGDYLNFANNAKLLNSVATKIFENHDKKFIKPVYSRIINSFNEFDCLVMWITTKS